MAALALVPNPRLPSSLPTGLHRGVSPDVYYQRELGVVSKSALDLYARAPALYRTWVDGREEEPTPAMILGNAVDCAAFEPDRYERAYAVAPDFGDCRKTANRDARDAWRATHKGMIHLSAEDGRTVDGMVWALRTHPISGRILAAKDGLRQITLRWDDAQHGLVCKGRPDYYVPSLGLVADLKTTQDATAQEFRRSVASYGYHRQEAFYRDGFSAVDTPVDHFVFIAIEKEPPYLIAVYQLDERAVEIGRRWVRDQMKRFTLSVVTDVWDGLPPTIQQIGLPKWAEGMNER